MSVTVSVLYSYFAGHALFTSNQTFAVGGPEWLGIRLSAALNTWIISAVIHKHQFYDDPVIHVDNIPIQSHYN